MKGLQKIVGKSRFAALRWAANGSGLSTESALKRAIEQYINDYEDDRPRKLPPEYETPEGRRFLGLDE